jgi:predicted RNase H-like nuclease
VPAADRAETAVLAAVNKAYPVPAKNCEAISDAREKIKAEILKINNEIVAGDNAKTKKDWLNALNGRDTILKNMQTDLACIKLQEEKDLQQSKDEILDALNKAGSQQSESSSFDKISKYFLYGIAGVMILGAVVILLKKKKPAA